MLDVDSEDSRVEIIDLGKFDLSRLYEKFQVASFERRIYPAHTKRIIKAVVCGSLTDNIITVFGNKVWHVIDGQHRIAALWHLYNEGKLKSYKLMVRKIDVASEEEARQIYLSINAGKALTITDILKAYDDGKVLFFNEFRDLCTHDGTVRNLKFISVFQAICYAKGIGNRRKDDLEEALQDVGLPEIAKMKELVSLLYNITGRNTKNNIFYANIFRPLAKLYFDEFKGLDYRAWSRFVASLMTDQTVKMNIGQWTEENLIMLYDYLRAKYYKVKKMKVKNHFKNSGG